MLFQALDFRRWKGPHGVSFQRVIGGVLHDFLDNRILKNPLSILQSSHPRCRFKVHEQSDSSGGILCEQGGQTGSALWISSP
jgi:hypothetical protein